MEGPLKGKRKEKKRRGEKELEDGAMTAASLLRSARVPGAGRWQIEARRQAIFNAGNPQCGHIGASAYKGRPAAAAA
jgi:hypothetical protein